MIEEYRSVMREHGAAYRISYYYDVVTEAPWELMDTLGAVTDWTTRAKAPGELILNSDRGSRLFYDFQEAVKYARQWTTGEEAAEIARREYEHLKAWCDDQWYYIVIKVTKLDLDDQPTAFVASAWGIESDGDHDFIIRDLIDEVDYEEAQHCYPVACYGI